MDFNRVVDATVDWFEIFNRPIDKPESSLWKQDRTVVYFATSVE